MCASLQSHWHRHQWDIVVSLAFSHIGTGCLYSCTSSISALKALGPWVLSAWVLSLWYPGPGFMVSWEALAGPILLIVSGPEEAKLKWYSYWWKSLQFTEFRKCSHCFSWSALEKEQVGNAWSLWLVSLLRCFSNNHKLHRFTRSHLGPISMHKRQQGK